MIFFVMLPTLFWSILVSSFCLATYKKICTSRSSNSGKSKVSLVPLIHTCKVTINISSALTDRKQSSDISYEGTYARATKNRLKETSQECQYSEEILIQYDAQLTRNLSVKFVTTSSPIYTIVLFKARLCHILILQFVHQESKNKEEILFSLGRAPDEESSLQF